MLGKWKATVQFVAIALAMLRPDVTIAGAFLDQWLLVVAALITVWSGVDYFMRFSSALRDDCVSRVFVTGGSGVVGRALVAAPGGAVTRCDRAGAIGAERERDRVARGGRRPRRSARRGCSVPKRWTAARSPTTSPASTRSASRTRRRCCARTSTAPSPWCAPRRAPACPRVVHTSSAATIGEAPGVVGREDTPHRGWYLSNYERSKTEGEHAAFAAGREPGVEVVCVNPSSVQGPGRAGGTARFLLAFLDGRLKAFVQTHVSLVDIADCAEGHVLAAQRGVAGERYLLNGIGLHAERGAGAGGRSRRRQPPARGSIPRPAAVAGAYVVEHAFRLGPPAPAGVPRDGPDAAARAPLRRVARRARAGAAVHEPAGDAAADRGVGAGGWVVAVIGARPDFRGHPRLGPRSSSAPSASASSDPAAPQPRQLVLERLVPGDLEWPDSCCAADRRCSRR